MRNYVIINGVNSLTIQGLAIKTLPPITKPIQRNLREEIDGRDGDIVTTLGYGAYDKTIEIGLFGTFDIDKVIAYFNQKGTITFSNEADKVYYFEALDQVDYMQLLKFRTANVVLHCQPFKYPLNETPIEEAYEYIEAEGTNITLNNTAEANLQIDLKGNTSQNGTPTPSSPIPINVVSGDNTIDICGKNLFDEWISATINPDTGVISGTPRNLTNPIEVQPSTTYTMWREDTGFAMYAIEFDKDDNWLAKSTMTSANTTQTFTTNANTKYVRLYQYTSYSPTNKAQLEKGSSSTTYEPYIGKSYPIYLGVANLFDKDSADVLNAYISGSAVITESANDRTIYIPCKPNTTYTIQKMLVEPTAQNKFRVCTTSNIPTLGTTGADYVGYTTGTTETKITVTTSANAKYLCIFMYTVSSTIITTWEQMLSSIQIEKGTKKNSYTPYGQTPIELCKINTYQDYIYKDNGSWYLHKEIGKVVLDGSESYWARSGASTENVFVGAYNLHTSGTKTKYGEGSKWLVNRFTYGGLAVADKFNTYNGNAETGYMFIGLTVSTSLASDLTAFKNWLSANNVEVYYVLATPTNTLITDTTLIEQLEEIKNANSYEGTTNIGQVNNDMPIILDMEAFKNNLKGRLGLIDLILEEG